MYSIGVDVGTGSVRAGIVDTLNGKILCFHTEPITVFEFQCHHKERTTGTHNEENMNLNVSSSLSTSNVATETFYEQSSDEIWEACCKVIGRCVKEQRDKEDKFEVLGIGFDATCSLVAIDASDGSPVSLNITGKPKQNIILWADHRAIKQAAMINQTNHEVLNYVGGRISPEMETPKLLWIKENLPHIWNNKNVLYFDLADFLVYKATNCSEIRSECTTVCKWTYLPNETSLKGTTKGWQDDFFESIGLGDLSKNQYKQIGSSIKPIGTPVAKGLVEEAAKAMGLPTGTVVSVPMIDAHAGGIGILGATIQGEEGPLSERALCKRMAIISGTSCCHMTMTQKPVYIQGIWGPFKNAMIQDYWVNEGGQSAVGKLIDHILSSHAFSSELDHLSKEKNKSKYDLLEDCLIELTKERKVEDMTFLTCNVHVLPYFHGNRSPRADPTLTGTIVGLTIENSMQNLAILYLATIQAIAYGTLHVIEEMNKERTKQKEPCIDTIFMCGGLTKNAVYVQQTADICQCDVTLPKQNEAMIIGSACLGAVAHHIAIHNADKKDAHKEVKGKNKSLLLHYMSKMNSAGDIVMSRKSNKNIQAYHSAKYQIFHKMYKDYIAYREIMSSSRSG